MNLKLKFKILEKFGRQYRFARTLGIDDAIVSKAVTGQKQPTEANKLKMADALDCSVEDIFPTA